MIERQPGSGGDLQTNHRNARARRIVTGLDKDGRSTIVSDEFTENRFVGDAFTVNMVWQVESIPVPTSADSSMRVATNVPPPAGFNYFVTTFPPDSAWDYASGYAKSLGDLEPDMAPKPGEDPAMHSTNTYDIITVVSGEVWAVMETGEKLLKQGDSLVQRGTKHAWHNRTNKDCVVVAFMSSGKR